MLSNDILRDLRQQKNASQKVIADYLGVTKQAYSLYELGKREPDFETLLKLGEYFDVTIDYLLGNDTIPSSKGQITDETIKFALFGGDVSDEAYEDVKKFAAFIKEKYNKESTEEK